MGRLGSSSEDTRTKLLNSLGMFQRELENYHSNNHTTGCNTKKNRHGADIDNNGNGNDTDRFRPIRPQHTRRFSDMPFPTALTSAPHHQRQRYNSPPSSATTNASSLSHTRSALRNSVSFETTLNDIVVVLDDVEAGPPPAPRHPWHHPFWKGNDDGDGDGHDDSIRDSTRSHTTNTTVDSHTTMTAAGNGNNNGVRFHKVVSVVQIPSRDQYSKRIKSSMWRNKDEINQMVERNLAQFHYENYDWRSVVEETDFLVKDGERIHPCHLEHDENNSDNDDTTEDITNHLAAMEVKTDNNKDDAASAGDDDDDDDHFFLPLRRNDSVPRI